MSGTEVENNVVRIDDFLKQREDKQGKNLVKSTGYTICAQCQHVLDTSEEGYKKYSHMFFCGRSPIPEEDIHEHMSLITGETFLKVSLADYSYEVTPSEPGYTHAPCVVVNDGECEMFEEKGKGKYYLD